MSKAYSNGIEIEYESFGLTSQETIVLISGLGVQMIRWPVEFCNILVSNGYHVVRFDNRDVGLSTSFTHAGVPNFEDVSRAVLRGEHPSVPYTLFDMVEDIVGLLNYLGIQDAHMVGRSMGGMIAQLFASQYPNRVLSLTAIMSSTGNPLLPPSKPEAMSALTKPAPNPLDNKEGYLAHSIYLSKVIGSPAFPAMETILREQTLSELKRAYTPSCLGRQIAAIAATGDIRNRIKSINAPTLVIHGKDDPLVSVKCGEDIATNIVGAKLLVIDGMGHDFPAQLYERFGEAVVHNARRKDSCYAAISHRIGDSFDM